MKIVVTGNIGCGKSTAVRFLQQALPDFQLFDFDQMVAQLYKDDIVQMQLETAFGTSNKAEISNIVHTYASEMDKLQYIMNGSILTQTQIAFKKRDIILDIPLFFEKIETAIHPQNDVYVLCICADTSTQIERVKARNGWSEEKIRSVMAKQLDQDVKAAYSDYSIHNIGSLEELKERVDEFILFLNEMKS